MGCVKRVGGQKKQGHRAKKQDAWSNEPWAIISFSLIRESCGSASVTTDAAVPVAASRYRTCRIADAARRHFVRQPAIATKHGQHGANMWHARNPLKNQRARAHVHSGEVARMANTTPSRNVNVATAGSNRVTWVACPTCLIF